MQTSLNAHHVVQPKRRKHRRKPRLQDCADVDGRETWFTAFTDVLKSLIDNKQESNLTSDKISEALLSAENVTMLVDGSSNYVKNILKPE